MSEPTLDGFRGTSYIDDGLWPQQCECEVRLRRPREPGCLAYRQPLASDPSHFLTVG
jgi:hypothetical protein